MEMRLARIAGVTTPANFLALFYRIPGFDAEGAALQMRQEAKFTFGMFDEDGIPRNVACETVHPECPYEWRITNSVANLNDDAIAGRKDRSVVTKIVIKLASIARERAAIRPEFNEVVGKTLGRNAPRMGGLPGNTAIEDEPFTGDGKDIVSLLLVILRHQHGVTAGSFFKYSEGLKDNLD